VQDEIDNLGRCLPAWKADVNDFDKLKPIRRSFHTLKGSGRLVGALALGEFAWKVENMLNRVLDKTIMPNAPVQALVDNAFAALPELLAALRGEGNPKVDIAQIMAVADKLAAGEEAYVSRAPARTKKVKRIVKRMVAVAEPAPVAARLEPDAAPMELSAVVDIEQPFSAPPEEVAALAGGDLAEQTALAASPLPNIDPVLFEILTSEVTTHLAVIDAYMVELAQNAAAPVSEPVLRAVHTLNGAIAMVDIPVISHVLAPLEGFIKRLRAEHRAPDAAGAQALRESSQLVRDAIGALEVPGSALPDSNALAARIVALRDTMPEPEMAHVLFDPAEHEIPASTPSVIEEPVLAEESFEEITLETAPAGDPAAEEAALLAELGGDVPLADEIEISAPEIELATPVLEMLPSTGEEDLAAAWLHQFEAEAAPPASAEPAMTQADVPMFADAAAAESISAADEAAIAAELAALERADAEISSPAETEIISFEELAQAENEQVAEALDEVPADTGAEAKIAAPADVPADAPAELEQLLPAVAAAESVVPAAPRALASAAHSDLPPIADDPQPDGRLDLPDLDQDLLEIFAEEGKDILDHADGLMAKLRETPHERDLVTGLQRDLHTLKGGARMAGLAPIGDLAHAMESLFEAVNDNHREMDRGAVESLERGFDRLHGLLQRAAKRQAIAMPLHAIARFEGLVSGDVPLHTPAAPAAASVPEQPPEPK